MRALVLLALLLPTAGAWAVTLETPLQAGAGLPFLIAVCVEPAGEVRILAQNATLDVREDRYLPAYEGCRDIEVRPDKGTVEIEARVRDGSRIRARAFANVTLLDGDWVASDAARIGDLRAPLTNGLGLYPALPGAPAPAHVRLVEARAPPRAGIMLVNDGPGDARLAVYRLGGKPISHETLAPTASLFLAWPVTKGTLELTVGARIESTLVVPKLRPGEGTLGAYGRTNVTAEPFDVPGEMILHSASTAPVVALIDHAREDVLVEAYTLTSPYIAGALARAADRGARVRVLLEGAPVGGVPAEERALVATLQARGVDVFSLGGEGARYRTVHSKLVVVDRTSASVSTENLGETHSRGYGIIAHDAGLAARIVEIIEADLVGHDITRFVAGAPPGETLDALDEELPSVGDRGTRARLVLSPDDPGEIAELVRSARQSVLVEMLRADPGGPMVDALIDAARAGARVHVLLDGRFDDGTNRETVARLAALGAREGLLIEARLDRPDRTLHAKIIAVDSRAVYVGSMNWVRAAIEDNREAGLIIESEAFARWFEERNEKEKEAGPSTGEGLLRVAAPQWIALVALIAISGRAWRPSDRT